jgi:hypothetical protein
MQGLPHHDIPPLHHTGTLILFCPQVKIFNGNNVKNKGDISSLMFIIIIIFLSTELQVFQSKKFGTLFIYIYFKRACNFFEY